MLQSFWIFFIFPIALLSIDNLFSSTTFNPFIEQDSRQIPFDQCPCLKTPSGYQCIQYDSRYQATSLDEAVIAFDDLTFDRGDGELPTVMTASSGTECNTADCVQCQEDIKTRLHEVGLIPNVTLSVNSTSNNTNNTIVCQRYRFSKDKSSEYKYGKVEKKEEKKEEREEKKEERKKDRKCYDSSSEDSDDYCKKECCKCKCDCKKRKEKRFRRQVTTIENNVSLIGTRFNLSCTQKGVDLDGTGVVSLCNKCWSWRRLPSNYFPQYVNELVCDDLNTECLSGYGGCSTGTRSIEVYRTDLNQTVTLTAGAYCECKIFTSSPLLNLVNGTSQDAQTILNTIVV
uniref:DUF281 domain-containing protein n=1 Tax=Strongyloides stercoralis TaxID=6248 RepID=A0A0K0EME9_STRER